MKAVRERLHGKQPAPKRRLTNDWRIERAAASNPGMRAVIRSLQAQNAQEQTREPTAKPSPKRGAASKPAAEPAVRSLKAQSARERTCEPTSMPSPKRGAASKPVVEPAANGGSAPDGAMEECSDERLREVIRKEMTDDEDGSDVEYQMFRVRKLSLRLAMEEDKLARMLAVRAAAA